MTSSLPAWGRRFIYFLNCFKESLAVMKITFPNMIAGSYDNIQVYLFSIAIWRSKIYFFFRIFLAKIRIYESSFGGKEQ